MSEHDNFVPNCAYHVVIRESRLGNSSINFGVLIRKVVRVVITSKYWVEANKHHAVTTSKVYSKLGSGTVNFVIFINGK